MDRTDFREALIQRLEATGVPAAELARRTGVSKSIIDKLRQRKIETTNVHDAILIARYFGEGVEEFCGLGCTDQGDPLGREIARLVEALPPHFCDVAVGQLKLLVLAAIGDEGRGVWRDGAFRRGDDTSERAGRARGWRGERPSRSAPL